LDAVRGHHPPPYFDLLHGPTAPTPLLSIDPVELLLPRGLAQRYSSVRRDLRSVANSLRGKHPPPFRVPHAHARSVTIHAIKASTHDWHAFRVTQVERHGDYAATLSLEGAAEAMRSFLPGQFITIAVQRNGSTLRRAYSICSDPIHAPRISITVKRVEGGAVSGTLIDDAKPGDVLKVRGPSGHFAIAPAPDESRRFVLFAAGSGITPVMSVVRTVLRTEPGSRLLLVYGNRSEERILFRAELAELQRQHAERLEIIHVLSQPSAGWVGKRGRIDEPLLHNVLGTMDDAAVEAATYLLCGPEAMMSTVEGVLQNHGVPASQIIKERFAAPTSSIERARLPADPQPVVFGSATGQIDFMVPSGKTLLEAGLEAGAPLKFSCAMGGCGACKVKVVQGGVYMPEPNALTDQEREDGCVLACISHPTEPLKVEPV